MSVHEAKLPEGALLRKYADTPDCFTDCYSLTVPGSISLSKFVTAFYTTWFFKLERVILHYAARRPSTDEQAAQLSIGQLDMFAAWTVEERADGQLLMCDMSGRTRSWFMVEQSDAITETILYFGSAVVPIEAKSDKPKLGLIFKSLLGFHKLYSRALLATAKNRLSNLN